MIDFTLRTFLEKSGVNAIGGGYTMLAAVPAYDVDVSIDVDGATAEVKKIEVSLPDPVTPFQRLGPKVVRVVNERPAIGNVVAKEGDIRITVAEITVSHISVETQVAILRKFDQFPTAGTRGPRGRVIGTPRYQARARSAISLTWSATAQRQKRTDGKWVAMDSITGGTGTDDFPGPWGPVLFIKDADFPPIEPRQGADYSKFETIKFGMFVTTISE